MEISTATLLSGATPKPVDSRLEVAQKLEATFIQEMLKHAGVGEPRSEFGGGEGEVAFASLLQKEYADMIVSKGGIGLTEAIFKSLGQDIADDQPS